jgi:hypothetical protein
MGMSNGLCVIYTEVKSGKAFCSVCVCACVCVCVCVRERESESETERDRQTDRHMSREAQYAVVTASPFVMPIPSGAHCL